MNKNMHISILMERIIIDYNTFIFKPIGILRGNYIKEDNSFIDEFNNLYYSINDVTTLTQDIKKTHYFYGHYTDSDLKKIFPANTKKESIQDLFEKVRENIWIGYVSEKNQNIIEVIYFPIINFNNLNHPLPNEIIDIDIDINDYDLELETSLYISEEKLKELINITDLKKLKEEIEIIYKSYIDSKNILHDYISSNKQERIEVLDIKEEKKPQIIPSKTINNSEDLFKKIDVNDMYNYITDRVIGQNEAIRQIITAFLMNKVKNKVNVEAELTRILLTGPTGCGKTLIIETMLEYLSYRHNKSFPFAKIPTSQLTIAGYIGMNLEDILCMLLNNTRGSFLSDEEKIKYAEQNGIVFLDEIDKKGSLNNSDVSGRGVLNSLLDFLTGADYEVHNNKKYKFNTKNLTIFAAGAFNTVYDKTKKQSIGFNSNNVNDKHNISMENFINEGLMPNELMGRFHKIVNLNPISENILSDILTKSKKSSLVSTQEKLSELGVELIYDESFINKVANEAHKRNLGARSLKAIVEESLFEIQWTALQQKTPSRITVTSETVDNPTKFILKPR